MHHRYHSIEIESNIHTNNSSNICMVHLLFMRRACRPFSFLFLCAFLSLFLSAVRVITERSQLHMHIRVGRAKRNDNKKWSNHWKTQRWFFDVVHLNGHFTEWQLFSRAQSTWFKSTNQSVILFRQQPDSSLFHLKCRIIINTNRLAFLYRNVYFIARWLSYSLCPTMERWTQLIIDVHDRVRRFPVTIFCCCVGRFVCLHLRLSSFSKYRAQCFLFAEFCFLFCWFESTIYLEVDTRIYLFACTYYFHFQSREPGARAHTHRHTFDSIEMDKQNS